MNLKPWFGDPGRTDFKHVILFFMVGLYPLAVIPHNFSFYGPYQDYFYAPRYALLAFASLAALALLVTRKGAAIPRRVLIPLAGFIFFTLVSALLAAYPVTAWVGAPLRYTGLGAYLFGLVLFLLATRAVGRETLLKFMVAAAALVSLLGVLQVFGLDPVPREALRRGVTAYGTLGNPDNLGAYAAFVLPAAMYLYITLGRGVWLAAAGLIQAGLLVSFAWGAWVGALAGLFVTVWGCRRAGRKRTWLALAAVLLAVALLFAAGQVLWDLEEKVGLADPRGQLELAQKTWGLLVQSWAFGLGPDHLHHVSQLLPLAGLPDKAPGLYLDTALSLGVFALAAYLVFIGRIVRAGRGVFPAMIIAYLAQGLFYFESILLMPLFWIVLGLAAGEAWERRDGTECRAGEGG